HHSYVRENTIIGASSLLTPGTTTEKNSVYSGNPAEKVRDLSPGDREIITKMASAYVRLKGEYE
ncbi:MAG: gamma carbonic anhydrase family protein, partial [Candidatus Aenigmatarchaeota archaeon]